MATPPPASLPHRPPSRLRRWAIRLGIGCVILAATVWGIFTFAFYNPLQGRVKDLDALVPVTAGWALRGDAAEVLAAPFFRRFVVNRDEKDRVLDDWKLSGLTRQIEEGERGLASRLPGPLRGFTVMGDLFGEGTVAFGVTDVEDVRLSRFAVATRVSARARMMVSALKHEFVRRRIEDSTGAKLTRSPILIEIDTTALVEDPALAAPGYLALVRDVVIFGNDRDLVLEAARLGLSGAAGGLRDRPDAQQAFVAGAISPVVGFLDLARLTRDCEAAGIPTPADAFREGSGLRGVVGMLLDPASLGTASLGITFRDANSMDLRLNGVRGDGSLDGLPAALSESDSRDMAGGLAEAAALAPAGSAVMVARLELSAGMMIRLLYGRAPVEVRTAIEDGFREGGTSLDLVARDADDAMRPGVSVIMERLPDCDAIALDTYGADEKGEFVLPLPGVLLAFRQKADANPGAAERFLRRAKEWMRFRVFEDLEGLDHGMTGFRAEPSLLTGDLALVKPAVAFDGDLILIASNEGTLRRALAARAGAAASFTDLPAFSEAVATGADGQVVAMVEGSALRAMLKDDRREVATDRVVFDQVEERKRIYTSVVTETFRGKQVVSQTEINEEVEKQMEERLRRQRLVEFPDAVRAYVRELEDLEPLRALTFGLRWEGTGVELLTGIQVHPEGR